MILVSKQSETHQIHGKINSNSKFCTGKAVRNLPYPPGGCPEGFHGVEDDESGLCYSDNIPCPEGLELKEFENAEGHGCTGPPWCEQIPDGWNCVSKDPLYLRSWARMAIKIDFITGRLHIDTKYIL
jgi:hypothetical protein